MRLPLLIGVLLIAISILIDIYIYFIGYVPGQEAQAESEPAQEPENMAEEPPVIELEEEKTAPEEL